MTTTSRHERRAKRRRWSVTAREARLAAWLARLDYKTLGETGAMRVPTKTRTWHQGNRINAYRPPPGQTWERSGPTYVVATDKFGRLPKPVIHHRWRRLMAEK